MAYSTDGINWAASQGFTTRNIQSVCYGNGKFVAAGAGGKIAYSQTGLSL